MRATREAPPPPTEPDPRRSSADPHSPLDRWIGVLLLSVLFVALVWGVLAVLPGAGP